MDKRPAPVLASESGNCRLMPIGEIQPMKPFTTLAVLIFSLIAIAHLYRLVRPFDLVVAGTAVPQWARVVGLIVASGLALMVWREARR